MKKVLSLICVLCLFISIFQVNSFAAAGVDIDNPIFSLEITKLTQGGYDHAVLGDSVNDGEKTNYSSAETTRPRYGETWNGVPYIEFARLNDNYTADAVFDSYAAVTIEGVDDPDTPKHENIADKDIRIEMWIRPYGNNANTTSGARSGSRILSLYDSVEGTPFGTTTAFLFGIIPDSPIHPWNIGAAVHSSDVKDYVNYVASYNYTDYGPMILEANESNRPWVKHKLNDGEWEHVVFARYVYNGYTYWRMFINGEYAAQKYAKVRPNKIEDHKDAKGNYLNYNWLRLGGTTGGRSFTGQIAAVNIYHGNTSGTSYYDDAKLLYQNSPLREKLQSVNKRSSLTLKDGDMEITTRSLLAERNPKSVEVTATINDMLESIPSSAIMSASNPPVSAIKKAMAIGYDENGKVICSADLTTTIKNSTKTTTSAGTLVVPEGKNINDIKVFFWDEDLRPYAAVACLQ